MVAASPVMIASNSAPYLIGNYYALLAVPLRQSEIQWRSGFRPAAWPEFGAYMQ
jgi:hypothetical protein